MKTNKLTVLITFVIFATLFGCKREPLTNAHGIQNSAMSEKVKKWYAGLGSPILNGNIKSIAERDFTISKPVWDKTKFYPAEQVYITPVVVVSDKENVNDRVFKYIVVTSQPNGEINGGSYFYLLPDKKSGSPVLMISPEFLLSEKIPASFSGAIMRYDFKNNLLFSKHFENGQPVNKTDKLSFKNSSNNNSSTQGQNRVNLDECGDGGTTVCIDWYWQTWINGVLVYEEYLYTTCSCTAPGGGGAGGGGGNPTTPAEFAAMLKAQIESSNNVQSVSVGTTDIYTTNEERARYYTWKFYSIPALSLLGSPIMDWHSVEKGVQRNTGGPFPLWYWFSLDHLETYKTVANFGLNANISSVIGTPSLNIGPNSTYAKMNLTYQLSYSFILSGLTFGYSTVKSASHTWAID